MEFIIIYLIGLIFCIIGRVIDINIDYLDGNGAVFCTLVFICSPVSIPLIIIFGSISLIGFVINFISHRIVKIINKLT